ncbi:PEP-CTERM sorting domain-containing protein [Sandaracinobacter neustonicus]|uniref:PEP-CTERM sorting domain-containing protein n=2 Tax=Sandaracinobacter neustonicus TaxID=1715348 RepID=A0A501XTP9_9SPHN|nr:PEP-CTERM sorting domain-containing protein [Sandaracinobacter neustonicus]
MDMSTYSVALQTLTWIIIDNPSASITPDDPSYYFRIANDGTGNLVTTGLILDWADSINSGDWTASPDVSVYRAISSDQDKQSWFWGEISPAGAVPEPATWALLISGFGMVGVMMRRRTGTARA